MDGQLHAGETTIHVVCRAGPDGPLFRRRALDDTQALCVVKLMRFGTFIGIDKDI